MKKRTKIISVLLLILIALLFTSCTTKVTTGEQETTPDDTSGGLPHVEETGSGSADTHQSGNYQQPGENENPSTPGQTQTNPPPTDSSQKLAYQSTGNGTCKVTGAGNCTDACIVIPEYDPAGEKVTGIAENAFYGNNTVTAIQIPATVESIGELALASCPNLMYVSVSTSNKNFKDVGGVLYTKDGTTLIVYPSASASSSCKLPITLTSISQMAFYNCKSLRTVYYGGTQEEWAKIKIGTGNYGLNTASIICSDNGK